jgi:hypothetical protein
MEIIVDGFRLVLRKSRPRPSRIQFSVANNLIITRVDSWRALLYDADHWGRFIDSTCIKLDEVVPKSGDRLTFEYEYDFGVYGYAKYLEAIVDPNREQHEDNHQR